jgi:hypothetical protein
MEASPSSKNRRTSFFGSMFGSSGRAAPSGTGAASSSRSSGDRDGGDIREEAPPTKFDEDEEICDEVHDMTQDELHAMDLADETLKIKDEALASLGKEIKATEEELERRIAEDDQDWAELQKPMYMHQLETISKQIESLETQIRNNNEADLAFKYDEVATDELTKEYKAHLDVLEDTKVHRDVHRYLHVLFLLPSSSNSLNSSPPPHHSDECCFRIPSTCLAGTAYTSPLMTSGSSLPREVSR